MYITRYVNDGWLDMKYLTKKLYLVQNVLFKLHEILHEIQFFFGN